VIPRFHRKGGQVTPESSIAGIELDLQNLLKKKKHAPIYCEIVSRAKEELKFGLCYLTSIIEAAEDETSKRGTLIISVVYG